MQNLFQEFSRRNVFRVGIAYGVIAWVVAQVAELALDSFEAPGWVMKTLLLLMSLGAPLVMIIAWAYELTPEGVKREKDVDRSQSITHETGRKLDYTIIAVLLLALSWFAWDKFARAEVDGPANTETTAAVEKSIAVLPFVNMSDDASNEYFSDGIAEEILNVLVGVKGLDIVSRTSSFQFKGRGLGIPEINIEDRA